MGFQLALLSFLPFFLNTVIVHVRPKVATCPLAWGEEVESASWVGAEVWTLVVPSVPPGLATAVVLGEAYPTPCNATPPRKDLDSFDRVCQPRTSWQLRNCLGPRSKARNGVS